MKIYKYEFPWEKANKFIFILPVLFKIIDFEIQKSGDKDNFFLWAEVNPSSPLVKVTFYILPTGATIPEDCIHRKTIHNCGLVWHLYECLIKEEA